MVQWHKLAIQMWNHLELSKCKREDATTYENMKKAGSWKRKSWEGAGKEGGKEGIGREWKGRGGGEKE